MPENSRIGVSTHHRELGEGSRVMQSLNHLTAEGGEAQTDDYLAFLKAKMHLLEESARQQIVGPCNQDVPVPECSNELEPICRIELCKTDICLEVDPCPTEFCKVDICDEGPPNYCRVDDCRQNTNP